jgi:hypothetical protein
MGVVERVTSPFGNRIPAGRRRSEIGYVRGGEVVLVVRWRVLGWCVVSAVIAVVAGCVHQYQPTNPHDPPPKAPIKHAGTVGDRNGRFDCRRCEGPMTNGPVGFCSRMLVPGKLKIS